MGSNRAGHLVKQPGGFSSFVPEPLPPPDLDTGGKVQSLLSLADQALGRLGGVVEVVPDPDQFIFMYVRQEAVLSSQIEGTHASLMDVLQYEAILERGEARVDVREIVNYVAALKHGLRRLSEIPLSRRLMCEVHAVLMKDVRGGEPQKTPGEFRRSQNWIGGGSPATARFVPPPPEEVGPTFASLERFLHGDDPLPALIKAGLAHAQFETIHPFLDGNGRTGRLLITFWLVEQGLLKRPLLYPSLYFKKNRDEYIDRLQGVRDEGAWELWLEFFLEGIAQVADEATDRAQQIVALRERDRSVIGERMGRRRAGNALMLHNALFRFPVVTGKLAEEIMGVSQPTASFLLKDLVEIGIRHELTGRPRNRVFAYGAYLDLFPDSDARS